MTLAKRFGVFAAGAAFVVAIWFIARARTPAPAWVEFQSEHMASTISLTLPDTPRAPDAARIVSDTFAEVDEMMSEWKPGSPLTAVNHNAGVAPVAVPPELRALIERSLELAAATDGAFDPTWAALWGLWDFKADHPALPDPAEVARRIALVDYRKVQLQDDTVYLPDPGMLIGLGAIAKGYAIDVAAQRLRDAGFHDFLILGGGQVYAAGARDGRPWRVGIRDPRGSPADLIATLELRDASASTSGDYERFFIVDGVRYHHILDPRTGYPSRAERAVTVVCPDATTADALSTALMIVDPSRAESLATRFNAWALLIDPEGHLSQLGSPAPPIEFAEGSLRP